MAVRARNKLIARLTQPAYALLRGLTDEGHLDGPGLGQAIDAVVADRLALADGMMRAARLLAGSEDLFVRRSARSRAYYAAYHAARAAVFAIDRRDVDDHERLPASVDASLPHVAVGETLKELKRLRSETDYSPYPGPNPDMRYSDEELEAAIQGGVDLANETVRRLKDALNQRA